MATRNINQALSNMANIAMRNDPMQGMSQAGNNINNAIAGLQNIAQEQTGLQRENYEAGVERNTQSAIATLNQLASATTDGQIDPEAIATDLQQYGAQIDMGRVNNAQTQAANNAINQWMFNQERETAGAQLASTEYLQGVEIPEDITTDLGKMNYVRAQVNKDTNLSTQAKEMAVQQYGAQLQVDQGLTPQWSQPTQQTFGDSAVMTQTNNVTGEVKQVGSWSIPGSNGTGADVFATDIKYRDSDGNIQSGSKGKDGRVYDRNGEAVPIGGDSGFEEIQPTMVDYHMEVMKNPEEYPEEQRNVSREYLNQESLRANNRGYLSRDEFTSYINDVTTTQGEVQYLDEALEVISLLESGDTSRWGDNIRQFMNKYAETMGLEIGEADINDLASLNKANKFEIVRGIVRAFAPVSDAAMNLTIESMDGRSYPEGIQAVKATRDSIANDHNTQVKVAARSGVGEDYRYPEISKWTKPQYQSKGEMKQKIDAAVGNQAADQTAAELQTMASGNNNTAPQAALEFLTANPDQAEAFQAKYGYLPEGY
ncbi:hypothetical protein RCJ22_15615 [Vibrio sp. FNV 38]|nr:hypothetical protein [Vibrio sp. FNV 38]